MCFHVLPRMTAICLHPNCYVLFQCSITLQAFEQACLLQPPRFKLQRLGGLIAKLCNVCREARHPFLDEEYVHTVLQLPLWLIANLKQVPGHGDKRLLRAALRQLGFPKAAARVKRAIQFGTGIGKLSNVRSFGSNRAANSMNAGSLNLKSLQHRTC